MANQPKKQFSLSLLMRVLLAVMVVASIGVFANSVMRYNALLEEQRELEEQLEAYDELGAELRELLNSDMDRDYIIQTAKDRLNLFFPDEEIIYNDQDE